MASFDQVQCGFNKNDETFNFGSRCLADNEAYESATLATIKCLTNETCKDLHINSFIKDKKLYYSVNNRIGIFGDKECSYLEFTADFDDVIDTFCVTSDGCYMYIFLRNGFVHILKKCSTIDYDQLCSKELEKSIGIELFLNSYVCDVKGTDPKILVIYNSGVFSLSLPKSDSDSEEIDIKKVYSSNEAITNPSLEFPFLFINNNKMVFSIIDLESGEKISTESPYELKSIYPANGMFLGLLENKDFLWICPHTLLMTTVHKDLSLSAIRLLTDNYGVISLMVGISEKNELGDSFLHVLGSDFSEIYSLKLTSDVALISPESVSDEAYYISKIKSDDVVTELRINCVYETDPEQRLNRLFRRRMFEEAEKFAKTHNIDVSIVNREKAKAMIEKLSISIDDIEELVILLDKLEGDEEFKLDCCLAVDTACTSPECISKILSYARKIKVPKKHDTAQEKLFTCNEFYVRFRLFEDLQYPLKDWERFSTCDLIEELKTLIQMNKFEKAVALYYHLLSVKETLDHSIVEGILGIVPRFSSSTCLLSVITETLKYMPELASVVFDRIIIEVFFMENTSKTFPKCASEFLENFIENYSNACAKNFLRNQSFLKQSEDLRRTLNELLILKEDYGIILSLTQYLQNPESVVRLLLRMEMHPEQFRKYLREFVFKYIEAHKLNAENVFIEEIKEFVFFDVNRFIGTVEVLLECVKSIDVRLATIYEMLGKAHSPWPQQLKKIALDSLCLRHPSVDGIRDLIEQQPRLIVLNNPQYKLDLKRLENMFQFAFSVRRIIFCNLPTMIDDVFSLCINSEQKNRALQLIFLHFLKKNDFESAFKILDNNPNDCAKNCIEQTVCYFTLEVHDDKENAKNCINILNQIKSKCDMKYENKFRASMIRKEIDTIKTAIKLKEMFGVDVKVSSIFSSKGKAETARKIMEDILNFSHIDRDEAFNVCSQLANSLDLEKEELLLHCCEQTWNYKFLCEVGKYFYQEVTNVEFLWLISYYLLSKIGSNENNLSESTFLNFNTSLTTMVLSTNLEERLVGVDCLPRLVGKATSLANHYELDKCLMIAPWINALVCLRRPEKNVELWNLISDGTPTFAPSSFMTFSMIQEVFNVYFTLVKLFKNDADLDEITEEISNICDLIKTLKEDDQMYLAYNLLSVFINEISKYNCAEILEMLTKTIDYCVQKVLEFVLRQNKINSDLLYSLLLQCSLEKASTFLIGGCQYQRTKNDDLFSAIAQVGIKFFDYRQISDYKIFYQKIVTNVKWWKLVKNHGIVKREFFEMNPEDRINLLIMSDSLDIDTIKLYAKDYNLVAVPYIVKYLKHFLLKWKPEYEIVFDHVGNKNIAMNSDQENRLYEKCLGIIEEIHPKLEVYEVLSKVWHKVNFYYYEVFLCILNLLSYLDPDRESHVLLKRPTLAFLKSYRRVAKPENTEIANWDYEYPDSLAIDPLSEFRIPFSNSLFGKEIWHVICNEVNLQTYDFWMNGVGFFPHLTIDTICCYVLNGMVSKNIFQRSDPPNWIDSEHDTLFFEIDKCLERAISADKKTSAAYKLLSTMPEGADQVNVAKITYKYALLFKNESQSFSAEKSFTKVEKKYQRCLSLQVLHTYGLAENKYIEVIFNGDELIKSLYYDERILSHAECPDINGATDKLAPIFNLNRETVKQSLLLEWLRDTSEDTLRRATYLCMNSTDWEQFLWTCSQNESFHSGGINVYVLKERALKCLVNISTPNRIQDLTGMEETVFKSFMNKITYARILDYCQLSFNLSEIDKEKKRTVLKKLAIMNTPTSVRALATLCEVFHIYETKYWEFIIKSSLQFNLFDDLKGYLNVIKEQKCKWQDVFIKASEIVILNDIQKITTQSLTDEDKRKLYVKIILELQKSPVLYCMDLEEVYRKCIEIDAVHIAAILIQYLPREKLTDYVKEVLQINRNIAADIDYFTEYSIIGTSQVISMLTK